MIFFINTPVCHSVSCNLLKYSAKIDNQLVIIYILQPPAPIVNNIIKEEV